MAFSLICLTLSRVRLNFSPISSRVMACPPFNPKYKVITSASLCVNVDNARWTSFLNESFIKPSSGLSSPSFSRTSKRLFSSPCTKGSSIETGHPDIFMVSTTSPSVTANTSANSWGEGSLSNLFSSSEKILLILFNDPTLFKGSLTIRYCSARACKIDCRIHQTA